MHVTLMRATFCTAATNRLPAVCSARLPICAKAGVADAVYKCSVQTFNSASPNAVLITADYLHTPCSLPVRLLYNRIDIKAGRAVAVLFYMGVKPGLSH